jgi:hypothetical protein
VVPDSFFELSGPVWVYRGENLPLLPTLLAYACILILELHSATILAECSRDPGYNCQD